MILCGFYSTLKMYGKKPLPAQAGKRQFMASGGQLRPETDKSFNKVSKKGYGQKPYPSLF
jgi:hypothetical protein